MYNIFVHHNIIAGKYKSRKNGENCEKNYYLMQINVLNKKTRSIKGAGYLFVEHGVNRTKIKSL